MDCHLRLGQSETILFKFDMHYVEIPSGFRYINIDLKRKGRTKIFI